MKRTLLGVCLGCCLLASATAQDVVLRHNLSGKALEAISTATLKFNDAQKGKARVILQSTTAISDADRAQLPHMALLDPDEALVFFDTRPRYLPLYSIAKTAGEKFDAGKLYPQILDAADDVKGRLEALPVGMAYPALFRNRALFVQAGLDPDKPPKTWMEVQAMSEKLMAGGVTCPVTSANFSRMHTEGVSLQHGQGITDKKGLALNSLMNVKHLALLSSWQKSMYFHYYGRHREAEEKFLSGDCAMITTDTTLFARLADKPEIQADVSPMPYHDDAYTMTPDRMLPEGASVWVLAGKKKEEYKVVARFLNFFSQPAEQKEWVKATAYLPMSPAAMSALKEAKAFPPALLERAEKRLQVNMKDSGYIRNEYDRARSREIMAEEIETIWAKGRAPMEALNEAVIRTNAEPKYKE